MKASNQVRPEDTTIRPSQQAGGASCSLLAICAEARESFRKFDNTACAAITLAKLNESHIKNSLHESGSLAEFDSPIFKVGSAALPDLLAANFESSFESWTDAMNHLADNIEANRLADLAEPEVEGEVEHFVHAICHLIVLQDGLIDRRRKGGAYAWDIIMGDLLRATFHRALRAYAALVSFVRANSAEVISQSV